MTPFREKDFVKNKNIINMLVPNRLKIGDKVAIISSARAISEREISFAQQLLQSWGLEVVVGQTIGEKYNQFAGTDEQRAMDIQTMLNDSQIRAIFFARGGYGSVRILDKVNWTTLLSDPKWLIGYSDVTAILMHTYYNQNIQSIHAIMPVNISSLKDNIAVRSLKNILFNGNNVLTTQSHQLNRVGKAEGRLIGGNLSVIYSLLGSNSFIDTDNKILFIEDLDEYLYHIDRMMQALKRSGKLNKLSALLVGQMSDMHDNTIAFGKTPYEIIQSTVKDYNFPIAFNLPIGHIGENNHAFIHGATAFVDINNDGVIIKQN